MEINYGGDSSFLLVTVPGRRTACRHCKETDHWTNRCSNIRKAPEKESYADKTRQAPTPPKAPKPTPTTTTTKTDNEADVETDEERATWAVVAPRKKRRRQGPTPKTSPACEGAGEDSFFAFNSSEEENNDDDNNGNGNNSENSNNNDDNGNNEGEDDNKDHHPQTKRERERHGGEISRHDTHLSNNIYI